MNSLSLYANLNAKTRVWLSKLLTTEQWKILYACKDTRSLIDKLENTRFAKWVKDKNSDNFAGFLDTAIFKESLRIEKKIARNLKEIPAELVSLLTEEYDIEQIKRGFRAWRNKTAFIPPDKSVISERHLIKWDVFSSASNIEEIMLALINTPYGAALSSAKDLYRKSGSLFYFEHALEKNLFSRISKKINQLSAEDRKNVRKLLGIQTDIFNVNNILRCKLFFKLPAEEINSIIYPDGTYFSQEKCFDAYVSKDAAEFLNHISVPQISGLIKNIKQVQMEDMAPFLNEILRLLLYKEIHNALGGYPFTLGVPLAYILLNRLETKQLRSLAWAVRLGKNNQIEILKNTNPLAYK